MPKMKWSELSPMQLGRYAEYYAKMKFIEINILTQKDTKCAFNISETYVME